jgi:hypothetical protein
MPSAPVPIRTLSASGVSGFTQMLDHIAESAPPAPQRHRRGSRRRLHVPVQPALARDHRQHDLRRRRLPHHGRVTRAERGRDSRRVQASVRVRMDVSQVHRQLGVRTVTLCAFPGSPTSSRPNAEHRSYSLRSIRPRRERTRSRAKSRETQGWSVGVAVTRASAGTRDLVLRLPRTAATRGERGRRSPDRETVSSAAK